MTWTVRDIDRGIEREFDTRSKAESVIQDFAGADLELIPPQENGHDSDVIDVDSSDDTEALGERSVAEDPIQWMPSHFIDKIQGVPVINRKGYCVLAEHSNISVQAEPVTRPPETDFEYAEFQATAETPDGQEFSGYGSSHVDRGDDPTLLAELAETRAMKRATAWATGVGMTAIEEMSGQQ
jgi:hypothetical protein